VIFFTLACLATSVSYAADMATEIKKLHGKAADAVARDRKGEPLDVIAEKSAGEKPRTITVPVAAPAVSGNPSVAPGLSRLDVWKLKRQKASLPAATTR